MSLELPVILTAWTFDIRAFGEKALFTSGEKKILAC